MKKKSLSLTRQIAIIVSVLMLVINTVLGIVLMTQSKQSMMSLIQSRMLDISNTAAAMIDGDAFERIEEGSENTAGYQTIYTLLRYFQDNMECDFIYGVREDEESPTGFSFVIDPSDDPAEFGKEIVYTDALMNAGKGVAGVDKEATEDDWGRFYSSFSPIRNSEGEVVGIVGVDFRKEWLDQQLSHEMMTIGFGVAIAMILSLAAIIVAMSGIRRNSKKIHDELAALSVVIDELITKIDVSEVPVERLAAEKTDDEAIADELVSVGSKVHEMRDTLDKYLVYMNEKAYTDMLTGVNNSTAYYNAVERENEEIRKGTASFAVLIFDINGLKAINDEYGHSVGDVFILKSVEIMSEVLGKKNIYRVGGDEFITIIDGANEETLKDIYERLDKETEAINAKKRPFKEKVSFARGATVFNPVTDTEFKDVFKRADMLMYLNKTDYYAKMKDKED